MQRCRGLIARGQIDEEPHDRHEVTVGRVELPEFTGHRRSPRDELSPLRKVRDDQLTAPRRAVAEHAGITSAIAFDAESAMLNSAPVAKPLPLVQAKTLFASTRREPHHGTYYVRCIVARWLAEARAHCQFAGK
jgi:hypothetical protein